MIYTHPFVCWNLDVDKIIAKCKIFAGTNLGLITGTPRAYDSNLFLLQGCFYLHSEMVLDARHRHNPLAWIMDGFFHGLPSNVELIPLWNDYGYIYGVDVVATKDIMKDELIIYHTSLPLVI